MIEQLRKELTCPICLSLLRPPTARLNCCHYFCRLLNLSCPPPQATRPLIGTHMHQMPIVRRSCITQSLAVKNMCPQCRAPANRREVADDAKVDNIAAIFAHLEVGAGAWYLAW